MSHLIAGEPEPYRVFFDRMGGRLTAAEWERYYADSGYRNVVTTEDPYGRWRVVTTWEGVVHDRVEDPLPFRVNVQRTDAEAWEVIDCATEDVAREVHHTEVDKLRQGGTDA